MFRKSLSSLYFLQMLSLVVEETTSGLDVWKLPCLPPLPPSALRISRRERKIATKDVFQRLFFRIIH